MSLGASQKNGASEPLLVVALNEDDVPSEVVLKLRDPGLADAGNHFGSTSLACELICSVPARAAGLPVPDYAIIDVPSSLVFSTRGQLGAASGRICNSLGLNFGTRYMPVYLDWDARLFNTNEGLVNGLEKIFVFDGTVVNEDRRKTKSNLLSNGHDHYLIDHSLTLGPAYQILFDVDKEFLTKLSLSEHVSSGRLKRGQHECKCLLPELAFC